MVGWNSILIVSPDQRLVDTVAKELTANDFKSVRAASEGEVGYCLQRTTAFSAAIVDLTFGDRWLNLLGLISHRLSAKPVLALVPQSNLELAVKALQQGAYDYLLKPLLADEVVTALQNIVTWAFQEPISAARRNGWPREYGLQPVVSRSSLMKEKLQMIGLMARTDAPLIITGPTGVGKSFFSRVIHFLSPRRFEPLTFINCRDSSSGEVLYKLFSPEWGILNRQKYGTIVLNRCFDLSRSVLNRIIAFWQEQEQTSPARRAFRLLGTAASLPEEGDLATPKYLSLQQQLSAGVIELPRLDERSEDVQQLADLFLSQFADRLGQEGKYLTDRALREIAGRSWNDHICGFRRFLLKAAIVADGPEISEVHIQALTEKPEKIPVSMELRSLQLEQVEETLIGQALQRHSGNMSRTATTLGISRGTLYNKIRKYGLDANSKKNVPRSE